MESIQYCDAFCVLSLLQSLSALPPADAENLSCCSFDWPDASMIAASGAVGRPDKTPVKCGLWIDRHCLSVPYTVHSSHRCLAFFGTQKVVLLSPAHAFVVIGYWEIEHEPLWSRIILGRTSKTARLQL